MKKGYSRHKPPLPLYTVAESQTALQQFREIPSNAGFKISPQFSVLPHDAGHILGATWLELTITENGKQTLVVFSGDVGRYDQPILKDPESPTRADFLLCESTYGDREHTTGSVTDELADVVNQTAKRGGAVVIPAFAVDRTQLLLYYLRVLEKAQRIPHLPVYLDSPMAINTTEIYTRHRADHDLKPQTDPDPMDIQEVHMTCSVEDSKKINDMVAPCIIISASGMITGGRVLHHLAHRLPDSRSTVLLIRSRGGRVRAGARCSMARSSCEFTERKCGYARRWSRCASSPPTRGKASCCDGFPGFRRRRRGRSWFTASQAA